MDIKKRLEQKDALSSEFMTYDCGTLAILKGWNHIDCHTKPFLARYTAQDLQEDQSCAGLTAWLLISINLDSALWKQHAKHKIANSGGDTQGCPIVY